MLRSLALLALALGLSSLAHAQGSNCQYTAPVSTATITAGGATQLIPAPARGAIHVCSWTIQVQQASTAANFGFISGTGTACSTNTTLVTPAFLGVSSVNQSAGQVYTSSTAMLVPAALCLNLSTAPTGAVAHVIYAIY